METIANCPDDGHCNNEVLIDALLGKVEKLEPALAEAEARADRAEAALKNLIEWVDSEDLPDDYCTPAYLKVKQAAREIVNARKKDGQA